MLCSGRFIIAVIRRTALAAAAICAGCGGQSATPGVEAEAARLLDSALVEAESISTGLRRWLLERAQDATGALGEISEQTEEIEGRLARALVDLSAHARAASDARTGLYFYGAGEWSELRDEQRPASEVVLLVHGLDEPGDIWDELAPALAGAGHTVARFDYPNDQRIAASADLLAAALEGLRARGVDRVSIVAHSMGGLVARDVLTRNEYYNGDGAPGPGGRFPALPRLILCGTPNAGATLASLQVVAEVREQALRFARSGDVRDLAGFLADGGGQAGRDLMPGSVFLRDLNARATPKNVSITCVVAEMAPSERNSLDDAFETEFARRWLGEWAGDAASSIRALAREVGDGVVPAASATLPGAEIVRVHANHRTMLVTLPGEGALAELTGVPVAPPPAIREIVTRLER